MPSNRRHAVPLLVPAALLVASTLPGPAAAQPPESTTTTAAPTGEATLAVSVGIDDLVSPDAPLIVDVAITARQLVVGTLELDAGGTATVAVEVPAGGVKEYRLTGPPPGRGVLGYTVTLRDEQGTEVASHRGRARLADTEVVGLLGADGLDTAIRSARTTPLQRTPEVVAIGPEQVDARIAAVRYLVAGSGAVERLPEESRLALEGWVRSGGRLLAGSADLAAVAEPAGGAVLAGTPATVSRLGNGELVMVDDPATLSAGEWGRILRDTPGSLEILDSSSLGFEGALVVAASSGRQATVPALPWLLGGILLFVVLVGPVNMLVLRALGRPEWSWVTIPALSVAFLAGFWLVGRSQTLDFTANHAAVVVDDGRTAAVADVGLLVQVADGGQHVLALGEGWQAMPAATDGGGVTVDGVVDDRSVVFELADLGLGTTMVRTGADRVALEVDVAPGEEALTVTVTNGTPWDLDAWGVVVDGSGYGSREPLPAGGQGVVEVDGRRAALPEPAVMSTSLSVGEVDYDVVRLLGGHLESTWPDLEDGGAYAFGITSQRRIDVDVDGRTAPSPGSTLLVRRFAIDDAHLVELGSAVPELLAVDGASSIERYGAETYVYGADAIVLRYAVPAGIPAATLGRPDTQFSEVRVWDWAEGAWVPFHWQGAIDRRRHVSAAGEIVVRASVEDEDLFVDLPVRMDQFALRWAP